MEPIHVLGVLALIVVVYGVFEDLRSEKKEKADREINLKDKRKRQRGDVYESYLGSELSPEERSDLRDQRLEAERNCLEFRFPPLSKEKFEMLMRDPAYLKWSDDLHTRDRAYEMVRSREEKASQEHAEKLRQFDWLAVHRLLEADLAGMSKEQLEEATVLLDRLERLGLHGEGMRKHLTPEQIQRAEDVMMDLDLW
jgi:hypothetical protein